ncbi:unnamed protein product [Spirodela intermedia]|uniref:SURP motif domain-containing protein n=1 Tax=Spirodela intermedia TaxID=51605 RepID=A0A7I8K8H8_SPIIN|nr:unnamed protein product [Spirodela intermedia]
MPDQEVMKDHDQDSNIINGSGNDSQLIGSVPVPSGHTSDKVCKVETEYSGKKKETPSLHSSPPTRPAEDVVHNIETLCKFMVNVGPQFENLARMKEVNNPSFSFLFGGEPGSAAAIGYDYFKWMKRKYRFESDNSELGFSIQASAQPQSSAGERKSLSPAESDMDMDVMDYWLCCCMGCTWDYRAQKYHFDKIWRQLTSKMITKNEIADLLLSIDSKRSGLIKFHEIFTMIDLYDGPKLNLGLKHEYWTHSRSIYPLHIILHQSQIRLCQACQFVVCSNLNDLGTSFEKDDVNSSGHQEDTAGASPHEQLHLGTWEIIEEEARAGLQSASTFSEAGAIVEHLVGISIMIWDVLRIKTRIIEMFLKISTGICVVSRVMVIRDEGPIGQSSVDSMKKDGKHVFSSEQHQSKNTGEVDHEPASHEIFDLLPGSDHAEKLQESPDSRLMEDTDQKPSGELIHNKPWHKSEEEVAAKQFSVGPPVSDQYDPLFDSIEPSSRVSKMISSSQEQDPAVHDTDIGSSIHLPADVEENNKHKVGASIGVQIDNDEFGETAPEAEVGAVENESPGSPVDLLEKEMGEVEVDQVRSPGKSKKTKDSKSMKLLKIALANFVKEVLKPSWRQGNMSKEAFKTIVKKTVDKVSGSVSSHKLPKSQAKINHYVESSQRKLTKLVMAQVETLFFECISWFHKLISALARGYLMVIA